MGKLVCGGATCTCTFGLAPNCFMVLPVNRLMTSQPIATIMDNKPMVNILPFGMCQSLANPQVAAATAAALGVMTPMPCMPVVNAPWVPGSPTVLVGNYPVLTDNSQTFCNWGGVIRITQPGQFTITVS